MQEALGIADLGLRDPEAAPGSEAGPNTTPDAGLPSPKQAHEAGSGNAMALGGGNAGKPPPPPHNTAGGAKVEGVISDPKMISWQSLYHIPPSLTTHSFHC